MKTRLGLTIPLVLVAVGLMGIVPAYSGPITLYRVVDLGGGTSVGTGIDASGQVPDGSTTGAPGDLHALLYSDGSGMPVLGALGIYPSQRYGANDSGQAAGHSMAGAFLHSDGVLADLGSGYGVNGRGRVAGRSVTGAFLYSAGAMMDLGGLGSGQRINVSGQVTGNFGLFYRPGSARASGSLSGGGGMTDLNTTLGDGTEDGSTPDDASDSNDSGQIAGLGYNGDGFYGDGFYDAFGLDPWLTTGARTAGVPVPDAGSSLLLLGIGVAGLRTWKKRLG